MNKTLAALAAASLAAALLAGCSAASTGQRPAPATSTVSPVVAQQDACRAALSVVYRQAQAGQKTGDMPTPAPCAGLDQQTYLRLAMDAATSSTPG